MIATVIPKVYPLYVMCPHDHKCGNVPTEKTGYIFVDYNIYNNNKIYLYI